MKTLAQFPFASIVFTSERIDDEVRETFYVKGDIRPCRYPYNVRIARFGMVQGDPKSPDRPRVVRILTQACRDPGEADGRTPCSNDLAKSLFYRFFKPC